MRNKLVRILSALVLGCLGLPAWAQQPPQPPQSPQVPEIPQAPPKAVDPLPNPVPGPVPAPLGQPAESPPSEPPSNNVFAAMGAADPCCAHGYWTAGGGAYFMRPYFSSNAALITTNISGGRTVNTQQNVNQSLDAAPIGFLSYTFASGFGIRGRWFEFNGTGTATASGGTGISPGNGFGTIAGPVTGVVGTNLHLNVIDLEATYLLGDDQGHWSILVSGGARYVTLTQSYALAVSNGDTFAARNAFNGFGPTVAFEGHYQLWNSPFALYGMARGSILFGTGQQSALANAADLGVNAIGNSSQTAVLPVGELEGAEVFYTWNRFRVFAQLGVVGQAWFNAGSPSQGLSLVNTTPSTVQNTSTLGFIGGVARLGVSF